MMHRSALPSELWMLVASNVSTHNDLAHLCISSSRLLHIIRPYLYRHVKITAAGPQSNAPHALELLAHDKLLAKRVVKLTIERCPPPGEEDFPDGDDPQSRPSLINLDALTNMTSLKHVALHGPVFRNADEQNEFGRVLGPGSDISLEELTYVDCEDDEFPTDRIGDIGSLKKLYWNSCSLGHDAIDPLWHILSHSLTTLHTLSLPFDSSIDFDNGHLWSMHFPHLRSLTLGCWVDELESGENFLDFILAHSKTIEILDLEDTEFHDLDIHMFDDLSWERLQTSSFPKLHSLKGHPWALQSFARARLDCLRATLRRLAIDCGELRDIFDAISSPEVGNGPPVGRLWALQEIEVDLHRQTWDKIIYNIQLCASCCPSLEIWRGRFSRNSKIDAQSLGELFALFRRLKVIYLHENNIYGPQWHTCDGSIVETFVHTIASCCRALQNVSVQRSSQRDWWTIARSWDPNFPTGQLQICSLNRGIIDEQDPEQGRPSLYESRIYNHWIHMP